MNDASSKNSQQQQLVKMIAEQVIEQQQPAKNNLGQKQGPNFKNGLASEKHFTP